MRRTYPKELDQQILELQQQGIKRQDIADQLNVPKSKVDNVLGKKFKSKLSPEARSETAKATRAKMVPQYAKETLAAVQDLYFNEGLTAEEVATRLSIPVNKVRTEIQLNRGDRVLTRDEIASRHQTYGDELKAQVREFRQQGMSIEDLAAKFSLKQNVVKYFLNSVGIVLALEQRSANRRQFDYQAITDAVKRWRSELSPTSIEAMAASVGCGTDLIKQIVRENGLFLTGRQRAAIFQPCTAQNKADITKLRLAGVALDNIAGQLGLDVGVVRRFCFSEGIILNSEQRRFNAARVSSYVWNDVLEVCKGLSFTLMMDIAPELPITSKQIDVKCKCGNIKSVNVYDFLYGKVTSCGCVKSKVQAELSRTLQEWGFTIDQDDYDQISNNVDGRRQLDIYTQDPRLTAPLAVEYNGLHFHSDKFKSDRLYHLDKFERCEKKGIRLLTIFSDEWILRRHAVLGFLKAICKVDITKIGARKCEVLPLKMSEVRDFLENNHIQGAAGHVAYGLLSKGELVAVCTFKKTNKQGRGQATPGMWELTRYCVKVGLDITGGFAKLFNAFKEDRCPEKVISFGDLRWTNGSVYRRNGFVCEERTGPDYSYIKLGRDFPRWHKSNFTKEKIGLRLGPLLPDETEAAAMTRFGYAKIWDCGKERWVWEDK